MVRVNLIIAAILVMSIASSTNSYGEIVSVIISEVELNPEGSDIHEWVELYNNSDDDISLNGWRLVTEDGDSLTLQGIIHAKGVIVVEKEYQWLDNNETILTLYDSNGIEIDKSIVLVDNIDDSKTWQRISLREWQFDNATKNIAELDIESNNEYISKIDSLVELSSVIDGDTIRVKSIEGLFKGEEFTVRFADINAPEIDSNEGIKSKTFLNTILEQVDYLYLDIDDKYTYDKYERIVAIIYIKDGDELININKLLFDEGYASVIDYDNEFNPSSWKIKEEYERFDTHTIPEFSLFLPLIVVSAGILLRIKRLSRISFSSVISKVNNNMCYITLLL